MPEFNKVFLMGHLTRDPEVRYTPKGTAVGDIGLAINDSFKASDGSVKETVTYVNIEAWGRTAENCKQYLTKGRPIFVEGHLKFETWEQDGQKKSKLKVVADRVQFLGGNERGERTTGGTNSTMSNQSAPRQEGSRYGGPASQYPAANDDAPPMPDDSEIPF